MRIALIASVAALALFGVAGWSQSPPPPPAGPAPSMVAVKADHPGRQVFERQCAPCHAAGPGDDGAPMLPGTMTLAARYKGELPGALELRTDLAAETLRYFVRNGSGAMPSFRKAELSDADIDAIAGYLRATAAVNGRIAD